MKISDGRISILINSNKTTIEIRDNDASITFASIELTPEQLSEALSRLMYIECKMEVRNLDKIGKKMEHKTFEFKVASECRYAIKKETIIEICKDKCPEGWKPDVGFNSQCSFFNKDDEAWARTTIRRWV